MIVTIRPSDPHGEPYGAPSVRPEPDEVGHGAAHAAEAPDRAGRSAGRVALIAIGTFLAAAVIPGGIFIASSVRGQTAETAVAAPEPGTALAEAPARMGDEPVRAGPDYRWRYRASRFRWDIGSDAVAASGEGKWVRVPAASERGAVAPARPRPPEVELKPSVVAAAPSQVPEGIGNAAPPSMIDAPTARPPALPRVASLSTTSDSGTLNSLMPPPRAEPEAQSAALPVRSDVPDEDVAALPSAEEQLPVQPAPPSEAAAATGAQESDPATAALTPDTPSAPAAGLASPGTDAPATVPPADEDTRLGALTPGFEAAPFPRERPSGTSVMIQVGVFGVPANATRMLARLEAGGFTARGVPVTMGGRDLTRIVAGPFEAHGEFDRAMALIRSYGITDAYAVYP